MRRLLKFIIAGSVAAASAQAVAGGLPETKANGDSAETSTASTTAIDTAVLVQPQLMRRLRHLHPDQMARLRQLEVTNGLKHCGSGCRRGRG